MSDIDKLKDALIVAARRDRRELSNESAEALHDAVGALIEAERPDVWQLLRRARPFILDHSKPLVREMDAALAWREANPDA